LYSYSFAPNPDWSATYASQPEILSYIQQVVRSSDCSDYIHLKQECVAAEWLDNELHWRVKLIDLESGQSYLRYTKVLVTAVGFCDVPKGADKIDGIKNFTGKVFHSARWDHSFDFSDKNVGVVGNGCSANQFISSLLDQTAIQSLVQFMRSPHWIAPKDNSQAKRLMAMVLRRVPFTNRLWRYWLAAKFDLAFPAFKSNRLGKLLRQRIQTSLANYIRRSTPQKYHHMLIPTFDFGAKRPVLDHGYLQSLHDPRVKLISTPSLSVVAPRELQSNNGDIFPADVLILANGFETQQLLTPMKITGLRGAELPALWQQSEKYASAYMGVCVSGFPNLFLLTGPNTLPSGHSTLVGIECSVEYITRLMSRFLDNHSSKVKFEVKAEAQDSFNTLLQSKLQRLIYTSDVSSWYMDKRTGKNTLIWPGSQVEFWYSRCVKSVNWTDFVIETRG
ncbi:uncharacterized protein BKA55DRAFT_524457, partial [Fusarium redolens]